MAQFLGVPGPSQEEFDALSGQVTELNSKTFRFTGGIALTSGADLNTFLSPGNYYSDSNVITGSLLHCPVSAGAISFKVQHYTNTDGNKWVYGRQIVYALNSTYFRYFETNGSGVATFTDWDSFTVNSKFATEYVTTRVDFKNLANDGTADSNTITIARRGMYLVRFAYAHCGASNITSAAAYWRAELKNSNNETMSERNAVRAAIAMPTGKSWDDEVVAFGIYNLPVGTYYAHYTNKTGVATDSAYNSAVGLYARYIGEYYG